MRLRLHNAAVITSLIGSCIFFITACAPKPANFLKTVTKAEAEAKRAYQLKDPKAADRAALRAEQALEKFKTAIHSGKISEPEAQIVLTEIHKATLSARDFAHLAEEEDQVRVKLSGMTIKAYRKVRSTFCMLTFSSLAPATESAAKSGLASLSTVDQQLAKRAWDIVQFVGDRQPTNGAPDWSAAAIDLCSWATNPPPRICQYMALGFIFAGLTEFALCEIESINPGKFATPKSRSLYHAERSVVYLLGGWDRLARREMEEATRLSPSGWQGISTTQAMALLHLGLAYNSIKKADWKGMSSEIAQSLQAWPDNPVAIFLTAEQLSARGEWAKAAESLDSRAAAATDKWLANRLTQRARDLRTSKGKTNALTSDPLFLVEMTAHTVSKSVTNTSAANYVFGFLENARAFGNELTARFRGTPNEPERR